MKPFDIIDAPQRSDAWKHARIGRMTASIAHEAFAKTKTGWSTSRRNLLLRLVLERLTQRSLERDFVSPAMQDGIDREAAAFAAYEAHSGDVVHRSGFLAHHTLPIGCSLDGHVGDFEQLLSIKCRQPAAHLEFVRHGTIPADCLTQMKHELAVTGAQRHVYCSWNPDFPEHLQIRTVTFTREQLGLQEYQSALLLFLGEVETEYLAVRTLTDVKGVLAEAAAS